MNDSQNISHEIVCLIALCVCCTTLEAATLYVDPRDTQATEDRASKSATPYLSISTAIHDLAPGDKLIIAPGTYRDSIDLRNAPQLQQMARDAKPTIIEAAPGAEVLIKGSDIVAGWEPLQNGIFVKRNWPTNSEQVFVDGVPLKQIGGTILNGFPERPNHPMAKLHMSNGGIWPGRIAGGLNEMTENSFFYDAKEKVLYIKYSGKSLEDHLVEVSVRPYLLIGQGIRNLRISGLHFAHANTTDVSQSGAISMTGDNLTLERIEIVQVDGNGFDITGDGNIVRNNVANYCGQVGMKVRGKNAQVIGNETSYNNTRGFNKWWEAGGAKFVGAGGLQNSEVTRHRAFFNNGDGIWFDWKNQDNKIHHNISAYNSGMGIQYESSQSAQIYENYVFANKQRGIYLPNSSRSLIANNLVVGNGMEGIAVIDEARNNPDLLAQANQIVGNVIAWNGKNAIVLPSEALENVSDSNLFLGTEPPMFSMGWGTRERPIVRGLAAWSAMSGQDKQSWQESLAMPSQLATDLQARKSNPDWSALHKLATNFKIPSERGARAAPGPTP